MQFTSWLRTTSKFSVLIDQKMQLSGWDNGNGMRNATWETKNSFEWFTFDSLYCGHILLNNKHYLCFCFCMFIVCLFFLRTCMDVVVPLVPRAK